MAYIGSAPKAPEISLQSKLLFFRMEQNVGTTGRLFRFPVGPGVEGRTEKERLACLAHAVGRHAQLGGSVRTARIPFSRQRRERLGLLAPMNLGFNPARASTRGRALLRSGSLLTIH